MNHQRLPGNHNTNEKMRLSEWEFSEQYTSFRKRINKTTNQVCYGEKLLSTRLKKMQKILSFPDPHQRISHLPSTSMSVQQKIISRPEASHQHILMVQLQRLGSTPGFCTYTCLSHMLRIQQQGILEKMADNIRCFILLYLAISPDPGISLLKIRGSKI